MGWPWLPSASLSSQYRVDVQAEREHGHHTWKLGLRASREAGGSVTVLRRTCLKRPVYWRQRNSQLQAWLPSLSRSKRQGNCFLSYLFRLPGTIVSTFERSENVTHLALRGVGYRSFCICLTVPCEELCIFHPLHDIAWQLCTDIYQLQSQIAEEGKDGEAYLISDLLNICNYSVGQEFLYSNINPSLNSWHFTTPNKPRPTNIFIWWSISKCWRISQHVTINNLQIRLAL